jgi:nitroreductase
MPNWKRKFHNLIKYKEKIAMKTEELTDLIKSRRSIRAWQSKPVPEETLLKAIEIATYAPNGGNRQNWYFYIVLNRDVIKSVADAVQDVSDKVASWPEVSAWTEEVTRMVQRASFFRSAPALIAVTTGQYQSPMDKLFAARGETDPEACQIRQWRAGADTKIQSIASVIAYLCLVLHQMGLGTVWMAGPTQAKGEIEKILKVPAGMDFVALLPVGYPAENPPFNGRKTVTEVCEVIR